MNAKELIESEGYENVVVYENPSYDGALIGVDACNRAVYDFDLMVDWLVKTEGMDEDEAAEFIEYNIISGEKAPIVVYPINAEVLKK